MHSSHKILMLYLLISTAFGAPVALEPSSSPTVDNSMTSVETLTEPLPELPSMDELQELVPELGQVSTQALDGKRSNLLLRAPFVFTSLIYIPINIVDRCFNPVTNPTKFLIECPRSFADIPIRISNFVVDVVEWVQEWNSASTVHVSANEIIKTALEKKLGYFVDTSEGSSISAFSKEMGLQIDITMSGAVETKVKSTYDWFSKKVCPELVEQCAVSSSS